MADERVGGAWYELGLRDDEVREKLKRQEPEFRRAGEAAERAWATPLERATGRVADSIDDVVSELNTLRGKAPEELARSFERAADSADEAFAAVRKLGQGDDLDTTKARRYAEALDEIGIEADQTLADLRELQAADPRFDTPEMQRAAEQLDRVGTEAREAATNLNQMKGVGADTHLERLAHEARESAAGLDKASAKSDGLMGKLKGVKGVLAGLGLALGAQQLLSFAGDAVEAFSELEQSGRSIAAIYGPAGDTITEWGARAAKAAGLSKREVNQSAATQGQALQNMGYSAEAAADTVVRLQQRGADLAATFGGPTSRAIEAIGSLLRGERDPIEKYGVSIKQADVNARILSLGLDTSTDAAKRHAEAVASLDLLMDQSAKSSGRFADETGSLSGRLSTMAADAENAKAKVGGFFATIELEAFKTLAAVSEAGEAAGRWITDLKLDAPAFGRVIKRMAEEVGVDFQTMKDRITDRMREAGEDFVTASDTIEAHWRDTRAATTHEAELMMHGIVDGVKTGGVEVEREFERIAAMPTGALQDEYDAIRNAAYQSMVEYAKGVMAGQNEPQVAFDAAMQLLEDEMTEAEEIANLKGKLVTLEHAAGVAAAEGKVATVNAINATIGLITSRLSDLTGQANTYGFNTAYAFASGLNRGYGYVVDAAGNLAAAARGQIGIESEPSDPSSPLYGHMKWGGNLVGDFIDSAMAAKPDLQRAMAALFDVPFGPDRIGPLVPQLAKAGMGGGPVLGGAIESMAAGGAGGDGIVNLNLNVDGLIRAETPADIGRQAQRGAMFGARALARQRR